jgi:hypothetical protein
MTTNKWVEFVRKWAKKHNQSYMCAASKQKCRDAYHAANPKRSTQKKRTTLSPTTRKTRHNKTKVQRELLKKFKAYAKHRKNKGLPVE